MEQIVFHFQSITFCHFWPLWGLSFSFTALYEDVAIMYFLGAMNASKAYFASGWHSHIHGEGGTHREGSAWAAKEQHQTFTLHWPSKLFLWASCQVTFFLSKISNDAKHWIILDLIQWPKSKVCFSIKFLTMCKYSLAEYQKHSSRYAKIKTSLTWKRKKKNCIFFSNNT